MDKIFIQYRIRNWFKTNITTITTTIFNEEENNDPTDQPASIIQCNMFIERLSMIDYMALSLYTTRFFPYDRLFLLSI